MYMFMSLFALCITASIIAVWVGISDRHGKAPRSGVPIDLWNASAHLLHRPVSGTETKISTRGLLLVALGCFCLPVGLSAQEVIHALSGTVGSANAAGKTITLKLDDGSIRSFKLVPSSSPAMAFDKTLQAQSTSATKLHEAGQHIIVFYYGYDQSATAVAFIDIGANASKPMTGSIVQYDGHEHVLTVKGPAAQTQKLAVNEKTVVDTANGAVDGLNYHPSKGRQIMVVASSGGAEQTAIFISPFE